MSLLPLVPFFNYLVYQKCYLSSVIEQITLNKISSICPKVCPKPLKNIPHSKLLSCSLVRIVIKNQSIALCFTILALTKILF